MIPSELMHEIGEVAVYQRGLVIDSQPVVAWPVAMVSVSKGIGD